MKATFKIAAILVTLAITGCASQATTTTVKPVSKAQDCSGNLFKYAPELYRQRCN